MISRASTVPVAFSLLLCLEIAVQGQSYSLETIAGTTTIKDGIAANTAFLRQPTAVIADSAGNIYIADEADCRVRKISPKGIISTIAGTGFPGDGNDGGAAVQAELNTPFLLALDKTNTVLYIGEYYSSLVRKLDLTTGILTTVAGNGKIFALPADGNIATQAGIDPEGIAVDSKGNLIIADGLNSRIRKVAADGTISTIVGYGGCGDLGDNGLANLAQVCGPSQLGIDAADNIYFVDYLNSRIRWISSETGFIADYFGVDQYPYDSYDGYPANESPVYYPDAMAVDTTGNMYVSEDNHIRYIPAGGGNVSTVAGTSMLGFTGDQGSALGADLAYPEGIFAYANGDFLLADSGNYRVRKIGSGVINTIAGTSITDGLPALTSLFNGPSAMSEDSAGNIYIADMFNNRIRKLSASTGMVTTLAGTGTGGSLQGRISMPDGLAIDSKGFIYFADTDNDRIYQIPANGQIPSTGLTVYAGGNGTGFTGDGNFANDAQLSGPRALVFDRSDNLYFADSGNNRVRKITAANGVIETVAGNGKAPFSGEGGAATSAGMLPYGLAIDADGTLFIADWLNSRVRRVDPVSGNITTIAGGGKAGNTGDGGKATDALLNSPLDLAIDAQHNLLISDQGAQVIRRVNLTTGMISTIAGTGTFGFSGENGAAIQSTFSPGRMFIEKNGDILVSDTYNDRVRRMSRLVATTLAIKLGDQQSGLTNASVPVSVLVTDTNGYAVQGQAVSFTVTSGSATLSTASSTTAVDGSASTLVTLGASLGTVMVRADSPGLTSVTFTLTITAPVFVVPVISGVEGNPQSVPPVTTVSMNGAELIFLVSQDPFSGQWIVPATPYPTNVANTCVTIGGVAAPIFLVSPASVGIIVPNVPLGPQDVIVTSYCGTGNDVASAPFSVVVNDASPEFPYSLVTRGIDPFYYITAVDTATLTPVGNPEVGAAIQGETISISAYGLGATDPVEPIGDVPVDMAPVTGTVVVSLAGNPLPPEAVLFVGLAPGAIPGLYRIDIIVPVDAPLGDQPVTIQINDDISPAGLLTIGAPGDQSTRDSRRRRVHK